MRISVTDLDLDKTISLSGTEAWLAPIYAAFPLGDAGREVATQLTGTIKLHLEEGGSVSVTGSLNYTPVLNCGRCEKGIPFPLAMTIDVRYMPSALSVAERELNLTEADLDAYFLEDDAVDVEGLIIDTIHLAIPTRLVLTKPDAKTCAVCGIDLSADRLYGSHGDKPERSPFAVLKDLKLS